MTRLPFPSAVPLTTAQIEKTKTKTKKKEKDIDKDKDKDKNKVNPPNCGS